MFCSGACATPCGGENMNDDALHDLLQFAEGSPSLAKLTGADRGPVFNRQICRLKLFAVGTVSAGEKGNTLRISKAAHAQLLKISIRHLYRLQLATITRPRTCARFAGNGPQSAPARASRVVSGRAEAICRALNGGAGVAIYWRRHRGICPGGKARHTPTVRCRA